MAKSIMEKLGLEPVDKLTKDICVRRVRHLKAGIKDGAYRGKLLGYARYYRSWYSWKQRGLGRAKKKAA